MRVWRKNGKNRLGGEEGEKEERACCKKRKAQRKNKDGGQNETEIDRGQREKTA